MKKFLRLLTPRLIAQCLGLLLFTGYGIRLHTFFGGVLAGGCGTLLILVLVGKALLAEAAGRIDKQIKDHIVNRS